MFYKWRIYKTALVRLVNKVIRRPVIIRMEKYCMICVETSHFLLY